MSQLALEITLSNLKYLIDETLSEIRVCDDAKSYLALSQYYRNEACGLLLLSMDVGASVNSLRQSAVNYLKLLVLSQQKPLDDYYLCSTRAYPLFDAVAICDFDLAKKITNNMKSNFQPQMEYEEDYYYYQLFSLFLFPLSNKKKCNDLLDCFYNASDDGDSVRYWLMKALYEKNSDMFNEYMLELISSRSDEISRRRDASNIDPYFDKTEAFIFIEGLALINLAKINGLQASEQYQYMPEELLSLSTLL